MPLRVCRELIMLLLAAALAQLKNRQISGGSLVCEVTDLKSEVKFDLRGHLEGTMASEVMKIAFRGNMLIDMRVIEVTELNFEVKSDL